MVRFVLLSIQLSSRLKNEQVVSWSWRHLLWSFVASHDVMFWCCSVSRKILFPLSSLTAYLFAWLFSQFSN